MRLYNFPWFARFLLGQRDRAGAARILNRYYELGGDHFLAFDLGPLLSELGMHDHLVRHARTFIEYGDELPPHKALGRVLVRAAAVVCGVTSSRTTGPC